MGRGASVLAHHGIARVRCALFAEAYLASPMGRKTRRCACLARNPKAVGCKLDIAPSPPCPSRSSTHQRGSPQSPFKQTRNTFPFPDIRRYCIPKLVFGGVGKGGGSTVIPFRVAMFRAAVAAALRRPRCSRRPKVKTEIAMPVKGKSKKAGWGGFWREAVASPLSERPG